MKIKTVINYHVATDSLKDALATAYDIYLSSGLKPDSIDDGELSLGFDELDALQVRKGAMTERAYAEKHSCLKSFDGWAPLYFSYDGGHLDVLIPLHEALDDFRQFSGQRDITSVTFTRFLRDFADYCDWIAEMNPSELCVVKADDSRRVGRILRRLHDENDKPFGSAVDFIYMRSAIEK